AVEPDLVAQPGDELDLDPATVQVPVEVEQVHLQQRFDAVHRGTGAKARYRRPARPVQAVDAGGEDAAQRRAPMQAQVRGPVAQGPAQPRPMADLAADAVRPAEQPRGMGELAGQQQLADAGGGNALSVQADGDDLPGAEALPGRLQLLAEPLQHLEVATTPLAAAEAGAGPDLPCAQVVDQDPLHELLGGEGRHGLPETQQADMVHAEAAQAQHLGTGAQQAGWRVAPGEQLPRQWFEAQRHGRKLQG